MVRGRLKSGLNLNVIFRYTSSYEKVQEVGQLDEFRRPVCWSASAEVVTIVVRNGLENVSPFRCDESCSPSSMFRVPVSTNQESRPQGSEERPIFVGRYGVTRRTSRLWISSGAMGERRAG